MKTYRHIHPNLCIDISMPDILFWFFKRFAKVRTFQTEGMQGRSIDVIFHDEAGSHDL